MSDIADCKCASWQPELDRVNSCIRNLGAHERQGLGAHRELGAALRSLKDAVTHGQFEKVCKEERFEFSSTWRSRLMALDELWDQVEPASREQNLSLKKTLDLALQLKHEAKGRVRATAKNRYAAPPKKTLRERLKEAEDRLTKTEDQLVETEDRLEGVIKERDAIIAQTEDRLESVIKEKDAIIAHLIAELAARGEAGLSLRDNHLHLPGAEVIANHSQLALPHL